MIRENLGELTPVGGGDPIPLTKDLITIGRRDSCDICLKFQNVSSNHCELRFRNGYWQIVDTGSTNGIKVNGQKIDRKALRPGDEIAISSHRYTIQYVPASGALLEEAEQDDVFGHTLLEKAGIVKPKDDKKGGK